MNNLIEKFTIHGLYGYKNISLELKERTTIVVAENGVGKTTLLSALNQVLTGEYDDLCQVDFKFIELKIRGEELLTITKEDILIKNSSRTNRLYEMVSNMMSKSTFDREVEDFDLDIPDSESFLSFLIRKSGLTASEVISEINFVKESRVDSEIDDDKFGRIKSALKDIEVLYLPTYRRVEKSRLKSINEVPIREGRSGRTRTKMIKEIEFGLSDVETKLKQMSEDVERQSNIGYRSLSASMLDDLITGMHHKSARPRNLPDIEDLSRFLIRVANRGQKERLNTTLKSINELYKSGDVNSNPQLTYFLRKLGVIINLTKEKELLIERFVDVCNKYLSVSSDSKILTFDARSLSVIVNDEFTAKPIKLDDLSSGEKQIISLMAHLYLDETRKIVLIDEPELSLSLKWQRMVLPDINNSSNICQSLAITHSPFVFDNELAANAVMLDVEKIK